MADTDTKICASCGREFAFRPKWRKNWDEVRYCSDACRRRKVNAVDRRLETAMRDALTGDPGRRQSPRGSVSPTDIAREVGGDVDLTEPARRAARRLVAAGEAEIVQGGKVVDPSAVRGPFRVRRRR